MAEDSEDLSSDFPEDALPSRPKGPASGQSLPPRAMAAAAGTGLGYRGPETTVLAPPAPPSFDYVPSGGPAPAPAAQEINQPETIQNATHLGVLGGKGVGKTLLFLAMLYRTRISNRAGALTPFRPEVDMEGLPGPTRDLYNQYTRWQLGDKEKLQTRLTDTKYFQMRMTFPAGLLRRKQTIAVDMVDTSGEALEGDIKGEIERVWKRAYKDATIVVFCLPIWAAFPGDLTSGDQVERQDFLEGFNKVLVNYKKIRNRGLKVKVMLALTMADDRRSRLKSVKEKWIQPYIDQGPRSAKSIGTNAGVVRYLANARRVSNYLRQEFDEARSQAVAAILGDIKVIDDSPWVIPVTAFDGDRQKAERHEEEPVPAHVELPLLVALCDRHNVLM